MCCGCEVITVNGLTPVGFLNILTIPTLLPVNTILLPSVTGSINSGEPTTTTFSSQLTDVPNDSFNDKSASSFSDK